MNDHEKREYRTVVLAALLHDIGKFMQRAEVPLGNTSREMESTLCPVYGGRYSHKHVLWTDHFFENCVILPEGLSRSEVGRLSSIHHRPDCGLAEIIAVADRLSSGMDRRVQEQDEAMGGVAYKRRRLRSVFESIELDIPLQRDADGKLHTTYRYELSPLEDDLTGIFPRPKEELDPPEGELLADEYRTLWDGFAREVKRLPVYSFEAFYSGISQLLLKYTWSVPSSTIDFPDVSLFDHLKTTAAIASCLYRFHVPSFEEKAVRDMHEKKFMLLVGDMSGIQDYIFKISHMGAGGSAKRLRARSLTVSLLTEIISHKLLHRLELIESNVLMSSGGKFYILLPNTPEAEDAVEKIEKDVAQWCYTRLNAELNLNTATMKLSGEDFSRFHTVFEGINNILQENKRRPFASLLCRDNGGWNEKFILEHVDYGEEEKLCRSCQRFPGEKRTDDNGKSSYICDLCHRDRLIGQNLPVARYIAFYDNGEVGDFELMGYSFGIFNKLQKVPPGAYLVLSLEQWEVGGEFPLNRRCIAHGIPVLTEEDCKDCSCSEKENVRAGQPMMFECIANKSEGRKVLGYLKADIDRLGKIFARGLKEEKNSVSRIAAMSRMLDMFFSGYVENLSRKRNIYIVYSGGDDLLLIGPWNEIIDFAKELRNAFARFTCNNPNITLSAGVILAKHRTPVFRNVQLADMALDEAKEKPPGKGRDQLWLFGDRVKWDRVGGLLRDAKKLSGWIGNNDVSIGFVRNLLDYGRMKKAFDNRGDTRFLKYLPLLTYDIARNLPDPDKDKAGIRSWAETLKEPDNTTMKHMGVVANYALTANRGEKK